MFSPLTPRHALLLASALAILVPLSAQAQSADVAGELKRWHPITLTFTGPSADEALTPNPFRDYRLNVTFTHASGDAFTVPGYFAADGNAAETGATSGTRWRVHFTPSQTGTWTYEASFREGADVALSLNSAAGQPTGFDGATGTFTIGETDKTGRDFRGKGPLRYVGERYLRFDNGEPFLKGGADSPESLLAYADFDGTRALAPPGQQRSGEAATAGLKTYDAHIQDWNPGDLTWQGGKGKGLIGALNYLASEGMNAFSFLTMNVEGDGQDVWPWTAPDVRDRYDVSKLAQWERVFTHADSLGLFLHFKTQETENDQLLDGGELGTQRKLYYRELVARFAHHLALNWNLGEENDLWEEMDDPDQTRVKAHAAYLAALDAYDHPIVIHSYPGQDDEVYGPLVGDSELTGASIQLGDMSGGHAKTLKWLEASAAAGRPWHVALDEPGNASTGVTCDGADNNHAAARAEALWANLMAGGTGVEWYFGYQTCAGDLAAQDWRTRDQLWDYTRHALTFFRAHLPFEEMESADELSPTAGAYVFAKPDEVYAVYVPERQAVELDLGREARTYSVAWYDPRDGGDVQLGTVTEVAGGSGRVSIGEPPSGDGDWVALVRRSGS